MKFAKISLGMLRYRVALMLYVFFLLGVAMHAKVEVFKLDYLLAVLILALTYMAATTINDIVDLKVDKINHPKGIDRPLVSGEATRRDMILLHIIVSMSAVVIALFLGVREFLITLTALLINYIYSVPPIKISYRTYFAPLLLSFAYVAVPFLLGVEIVNSHIDGQDLFLLTSLLLLFGGRILLKDFRDRRGDAKYGKPTMVLKYGKNFTVGISFVLVSLGNVLLLLFLWKIIGWSSVILQIFFIFVYFMLFKLYKASSYEKELITIGIGAKIANGLLLSLLGILILRGYNSSDRELFIFLTGMVVFYSFALYVMQKDSLRI